MARTHKVPNYTRTMPDDHGRFQRLRVAHDVSDNGHLFVTSLMRGGGDIRGCAENHDLVENGLNLSYSCPRINRLS